MMLRMCVVACLMFWHVTASRVAAQPTQPDEMVAAEQAPVVSPEARRLLDAIRDAYAALQRLEVAGTYRLELDASGQKQDNSADFTASFLSPDRFRHELRDDSLIVSNGKHAYLFVPRLNRYYQNESAQSRPPLSDLPAPLSQLLRQQNPSLRAAICNDASAALLEGAQSASLGDAQRINQTDYHVIEVVCDKLRISYLIDRQTYLIRQVRCDFSDDLTARGLYDVKRALLTVDYTQINPNAAVAEQTFVWEPPANAIEARPTASVAPDENAEALVGKPAPDFTLKDMEAKPVTLSELRGSVVVLDFWATWCGPCREALPHLEKLRSEFAEQGVSVYAVNLREDERTAHKFIEQNKLALPVLLDLDGKVAEKYAVSGIPQTVVIGKNGAIRNVLVGFGPGSVEALRNAIQQALEAN